MNRFQKDKPDLRIMDVPLSRHTGWAILFFIATMTLFVWLTLVGGCNGKQANPIVIERPQAVDIDQLSGLVAAKVQADLRFTGIDYKSTGLGLSGFVSLVLHIWLSHRREMKRLECNGHAK